MSIVHREVAEGIFQLSSDTFPLSTGPGPASRNSYLIRGDREALLFDLALEEKDLKEYAQHLAGKPLRLVLSHAHVDHIYHIRRFPDVWMHPDDIGLLRRRALFQRPVLFPPTIHMLLNGSMIDLGGRKLQIVHIPGHTDGSILLWDVETRTLLSGDTVARRLLYGMHHFIPFSDFCQSLGDLKGLGAKQIFCAHDRCALETGHLDRMISVLSAGIPEDCRRQKLPLVGEVCSVTVGSENNMDYFDLAVRVRKIALS